MAITPVGGATTDPGNANAVVLPQGFGSGANTQLGAVNAPPPVSQTMDAGAIQNNQTNGTSIQFPQQNTSAPGSIGDNTSVPSPIPTAASVIDQGTQTTPAQDKQKSILDRIAGLVGGGKGQTTLTNEAENAAGIPAMNKAVNDLNTQLQGLNDQATALQNDAQYTIPNQQQLNASGRGVTAGGLAPHQADAVRLNQIKQGAIATQALTLKSAIYAAQGNLALAKDAADKAANAQYEDQQRQIDYQKALLDANAPQLTREEKAQADKVTAQLADRQTQIDQAKEDKKSIIGWAVAVMQNNPTNPDAQYAAQQALQESNSQKPDLTKAFNLVSKYVADPNAAKQAIADIQYKQAQTRAANSSAAKDEAEAILKKAQLTQPGLGKPATATQETTALYANRIEQSNQILSAMEQDVAKAGAINFAAQQQYPDFLNAIKSDQVKSYDQAQRNFINAVLRRESGASISPAEFDSARKQYLPIPGDSLDILAQKKATRDLVQKGFIDGSGTAYTPLPVDLGNTGKNTNPAKGTDGAQFGHPGYVSDGTQWVLK